MTVHQVRLHAHKPEGVSLEQARNIVDDWISKHEELLTPERDDVMLKGGDGVSDEPLHFYGQFRFSLNSTKGNLLDTAENDLQGNVDWYRLLYHGCDHDRDPEQDGSCSWDDERTWGPVPSEVGP